MDAYLLDWLNLLLRFAHVITGIAWIGASFYFVFLDLSLTPPTDPVLQAKGVDGELWAVHGGGFYNPQKYLVAPKALPAHLHWFIWESYSTWLTGFALFTVLYLFNADIFLIDKHVLDWSAGAAVVAALAFLAAGWLVYDAICRLFGQRARGDLIVGVLLFVFVVAATWVACHLFAGRAAFLLVGAMLATAMSANVLFWIIPGQRKVIAQMRAGQPVDPVHGQRAKQRSLHNTYFTLPVLVSMISNHYGWLYQAPHNWLVLVVLMLAAALVRHSFVARHQALLQQRRVPWGYAIAGVAMVVAVTAALVPVPSKSDAAAAPATMAAVKAIVDRRCVLCHNAQVQQKNVELDTAALIRQHAQAVYQQVVVLKLMPLGNATQITDAERALIKRWYEAGAKPD
ncbi:MAG TPA: urate hydroxylase PuuD [Burkholderiaceae bacterium]|nr:urate hydroxylase PuuD [Burkholderiaceae bacterium]